MIKSERSIKLNHSLSKIVSVSLHNNTQKTPVNGSVRWRGRPIRNLNQFSLCHRVCIKVS